jgi:hypothetical protein
MSREFREINKIVKQRRSGQEANRRHGLGFEAFSCPSPILLGVEAEKK